MAIATKCTCGYSITGVCTNSVKECKQLISMEENTQLPKEVVDKIEQQAHDAAWSLYSPANYNEFTSYQAGYTKGATAFYQENKEREKAVDFAMHINSAEQGSREDFESSYDHWNTSELREANNRDLDESAAGREDVDPQELWDEHSALIGDDIDDLSFWAGKEVMTKADFFKALKQQKEK